MTVYIYRQRCRRPSGEKSYRAIMYSV